MTFVLISTLLAVNGCDEVFLVLLPVLLNTISDEVVASRILSQAGLECPLQNNGQKVKQ